MEHPSSVSSLKAYIEANIPEMYPSKGHLFKKLPLLSLVVFLLSSVATGFLLTQNKAAFYTSFHISWVYFLSIALGSLVFVLIQYAAKVGTSVVFRRMAENLSATLLFLAPLGIFLYWGGHDLFHHWMSAEALQDDVIQSKAWYLNNTFFYGRSAFYLILWCVIAFIFYRKSTTQDVSGSQKITVDLQNWSYGFLCLMGLTISFAAFDWIMSLDPHWYSTIFGIYFFAGSYVAACSAVTVLTYVLHKTPGFSKIIRRDHFHDLSKLMFGFVCFWAYAGFFQYMLIWYGNIPEETQWFAVRQSESWIHVSLIIILGHFVLPFFYLLSKKVKSHPRLALLAAVWLLVMHYIDIYWLMAPSIYGSSRPSLQLIDLAIFLALASLFVGGFSFFASRNPLIPVRDPRLDESLEYVDHS
jgi:hypothetical protein